MPGNYPVRCLSCGQTSRLITRSLRLCVNCIRTRFDEVKNQISATHRSSRIKYGLPHSVPADKSGISCHLCGNKCRIPKQERGFCGLRENQNNILVHLAGSRDNGLVSWYHDPLPTNCVADWVCAGGSEAGYSQYSYSKSAEYGYQNLAVFYEACTFNCLFCQNWHYREITLVSGKSRAEDLVNSISETTSCICFFGGDPTPQMEHALAVARLARERKKSDILRICWETNGSMDQSFLKEAASISLESGGCIKFDLKAFDERLNFALCGVSNKQTLENFRWLANIGSSRPDPPSLVASTLLVPGYVDVDEVKRIADFISSIDRSIPYVLLAFYPSFQMNDLPCTSSRHAEASLIAARAAGLQRVRLGNTHLLSDNY